MSNVWMKRHKKRDYSKLSIVYHVELYDPTAETVSHQTSSQINIQLSLQSVATQYLSHKNQITNLRLHQCFILQLISLRLCRQCKVNNNRNKILLLILLLLLLRRRHRHFLTRKKLVHLLNPIMTQVDHRYRHLRSVHDRVNNLRNRLVQTPLANDQLCELHVRH